MIKQLFHPSGKYTEIQLFQAFYCPKKDNIPESTSLLELRIEVLVAAPMQAV